MRKLWTVLCLCLLGALCFGQMGCVNKCTVVMPVLIKTQSIVQDAAFAISQVRDIVNVVPMPDSVKGPLKDALTKAEAGLKVANTVIMACEDACNAPDLKTAFADFNKAWADVRTLLTLFGKSSLGVEFRNGRPSTSPELTPASQPVVPDPAAFSYQ